MIETTKKKSEIRFLSLFEVSKNIKKISRLYVRFRAMLYNYTS